MRQRVTEEQKQRTRQQADRAAYRQSVTGEVRMKKLVSVRDSKHLVVQIERSGGDRVIADLGPSRDLNRLDLGLGDRINVQGPLSKIGNKRVLLAQQVRSEGESARVDRSRRSFSGTITDTHEANIRGSTRLIAMLETDRGRKIAVDLGAEENLPGSIRQGTELTVEGAPVKVRDTALVMAQSITHDGQRTRIQRRPTSPCKTLFITNQEENFFCKR